MDIDKTIKDNEGLIGKVLKDIHFRNIRYGDYEEAYSSGRIGLYNAIKTYDGSVKASTYYYKCIKNEILKDMQLKNSKRNKFNNSLFPLETNNGDGSLENLIPDDIDLENDIILEEIKREVRNTLERLKPEYKQVMILHFGIECREHTFEEISAMLGTTPQNIYLLYKKAQRKFIREWKYDNNRSKK